MADSAYFELRFCPSVELVSVVRRFVGTFYENIIADRDFTSRVALAAHEMLENAVKYSLDGDTTIRVDLGTAQSSSDIVIRTRNRAGAEDLRALDSLLAEMRRSRDPLAFYQALVTRKARNKHGSGLGLGRVAAEAEMTLRCEICGDAVEIVAQAHIPRGAGR